LVTDDKLSDDAFLGINESHDSENVEGLTGNEFREDAEPTEKIEWL